MIGEWFELLQLGMSRHLNGELDRCFWNALGPSNFLSANRNIERYSSFSFGPGNDPQSTDPLEFLESISPDGSEVIVVKARMNWYVASYF